MAVQTLTYRLQTKKALYGIANLGVELPATILKENKKWENFISYETAPLVLTAQVVPQGVPQCGVIIQTISYKSDILISNGESRASISMDWSNVSFASVGTSAENELILLVCFSTHAVRRQMLQLHCATIDDGGRGVLFLGPSGIGKTTQAERWAQFRGASIINGDVGFVQRTEREYIAWGTPWHGSSPYCLNASVPVKALVVLKQAPENRLRELTGFEKVAEVSGSVFYPTWLEDGMELCTDTLNHLLTDLPVYRLDNRADRESVEILAKELDRIS